MREGMLAQGNTVMRLFVASKVRLIVSWGVYDHFFSSFIILDLFYKIFCAHTHVYKHIFFKYIQFYTLLLYLQMCYVLWIKIKAIEE